MTPRQQILRHRRRRGFTLMEVLLVLVLLAIITTMAWPVLQKPFASRQILLAADSVRSAWCLGRVEAMRSGLTYTFHYSVGGDTYSLEPEPNQGAVASANPSGSGPLRYTRMLPEGVMFFGGAATGESSKSATEIDTLAAAQGTCDPVFFFPDGTTSDARLTLRDGRNSSIRLVLRGLTGTVTVGKLAE